MAFPLPGFIQFYPTLRCNQQCSFCFNRGLPPFPDMTHRDARDLLAVLVRHGVRELDIMGGEPLLVGWMPEFVREAIQKGLSVNLSTNGSLPERVSAFRGISPARLRIGVSLEGDRTLHQELTASSHYDRAIAAISAIRKAGLEPIVKTVLTREGRDAITGIIPLLSGLGVKRYFLIHADVLSHDPRMLGQSLPFPDFLGFFRQIRASGRDVGVGRVHASCFSKDSLPEGVRCAGGVKKLAVMPNGSAYPCNLLAHFPEFCLGNILTGDIEAIWSHQALSALRSFSGNACDHSACEVRPSCTGGCPAHNLAHADRIDGRDIRCTALG